ncbi:MAG: excinuclease ABC subunit UvrC [Patescibacteria group bacterium]
MVTATLKQKISNLPKTPGVYIYYDYTGNIIYVGKAKSLKDRVSSYFVSEIRQGAKTVELVKKITDLSFIEVQSELEALILESNLIKKYRPKFNINLKDDKSYRYIFIKDEKIDGEILPVVGIGRENIKVLHGKYDVYGPYPQGRVVTDVVRSLRKIIPFRDCSLGKYKRYQRLEAPCLYGHLKLCSAPCVNLITKEKYRKSISYLRKFLRGGSSTLIQSLKKSMIKASAKGKYEEALYFRDILRKYEYVRQRVFLPESYLENPNLSEDLREEALRGLVRIIPSLTQKPRRIECYDISNISGTMATASMTVAINGRPVKENYRRFKIKSKATPDDFEMLREVMARRLDRTDWEKADLVVIDGGKGQVSAVLKVMEVKNVSVPVIGLAKRFETIVFKDAGKFYEVNLASRSEALKLLQVLRDEAHRFAKKYHHLLQLKNLDLPK